MGSASADFVLSRRSCRHFLNQPLGEGDLEVLMEALRRAPSAGNCQPWFFYVVSDRNAKAGLADAAYGQSFLADAGVVFVVCADPQASGASYGSRGTSLYCLQDTAAAVENLLLAATALGYGSCWVGAFDEDRAREVLGIPAGLRPVAIVPVGPGEIPSRAPSRKPASEVFRMVD